MSVVRRYFDLNDRARKAQKEEGTFCCARIERTERSPTRKTADKSSILVGGHTLNWKEKRCLNG